MKFLMLIANIEQFIMFIRMASYRCMAKVNNYSREFGSWGVNIYIY